MSDDPISIGRHLDTARQRITPEASAMYAALYNKEGVVARRGGVASSARILMPNARSWNVSVDKSMHRVFCREHCMSATIRLASCVTEARILTEIDDCFDRDLK
jgi:hypothetical protein